MAGLSITTAWNEASEFVRREAGLLFPTAFMLVALPSGVLELMMPAAAQGERPAGGAWLLFLPIALVLGMIGSLALTHLALRPGASVGEALQLGVRRFIILIGTMLLLGLGAMVALIPVTILIGVAIGFGGGGGGGGDIANAPLFVLMMVAVVIAAVALWVRLMLITPVTAAEPVGPIAAIRRSWELTRGHYWKLLAFVLLILLVFVVLTAVAGIIGGLFVMLVAGQPEPGSLASLLVILIGVAVNMVVTVYIAALTARIYRQLASAAPTDVFA